MSICAQMFGCFVQENSGQWLSMDSEIIMKNGEPIGTQTPTGHFVLVETHYEMPSGEIIV